LSEEANGTSQERYYDECCKFTKDPWAGIIIYMQAEEEPHPAGGVRGKNWVLSFLPSFLACQRMDLNSNFVSINFYSLPSSLALH
jgi:hypothetical protein